MLHLKESYLVRMLAVVCVAMQVAVALPHHHHEGSDAPCINVFHCMGDCAADHSCGDTARIAFWDHAHAGCCGHADAEAGVPGHSHDPGDDSCTFNHIDTAYLLRGQQEDLAQAMSIPAMIPVYAVPAPECTCNICEILPGVLGRLWAERPAPDINTGYIATAIPPRAPSLTA